MGFWNWFGFFDTNVLATSQIVCVHRNVVVRGSW